MTYWEKRGDSENKPRNERDFFYEISSEIERTIDSMVKDSTPDLDPRVYKNRRYTWLGLQERLQTLKVVSADERFTSEATQEKIEDLEYDHHLLNKAYKRLKEKYKDLKDDYDSLNSWPKDDDDEEEEWKNK
ncbi:hypothetical protein COU62_04400 [Candidatus Pacearchaeota archaeon CG10_big_fil_rev_8_21_14_0_10_35_219]|nr:hypothetical protein [Candidatus Pacearchaeota archaeon]OIO42093.1 MAG: hypothetical protein AUJ63_04070 [Candidatus Pacearchaeota archaeon CG1_02_35_32]PIO07233.1 MAG: hypothetical protein COU62_04400 [Candidatus Pacearchaeota archaeon CG10_big_fil_rev_8_21_14_0_10_35_219]PIY81198.1 MAG: hypothetical protein COY79_04110 [Candidatus Pacearchaeota archaeon CG_4_10_14_0_8_um_filter_35_169]PIZ79449.1 MAG: hypothetical protein COY00_04120 [Candidatus Pacearchaeota archaeon CG_4_10_14_0_2_um_filt